MMKKIKNYLISIFNIASTGFTAYMVISIIYMKILGQDTISIEGIISALLITLIASILYYIVWYTSLLGNIRYMVKNLIFYIVIFALILLFNNVGDITLSSFISLFIYYNVIYLVLWFVYVIQNNKEIEDLNRAIKRIKESSDDK